jgi:hypothetical protein
MAEKAEKKRPIAEQPYWHPIAMLVMIARHIDGMVEAGTGATGDSAGGQDQTLRP